VTLLLLLLLPLFGCFAISLSLLQADTVIFDDELSPGQLRNLEKAFSGGRDGAQVRETLCCRAWLLRSLTCHCSITAGTRAYTKRSSEWW
jgi:hypothetical protein